MVREYVHWMTYWIVLAAVTLAEEVADLLLGCWLPLYYEAKLVLLLWLISPVSRSTLALILTEPHEMRFPGVPQLSIESSFIPHLSAERMI